MAVKVHHKGWYLCDPKEYQCMAHRVFTSRTEYGR